MALYRAQVFFERVGAAEDVATNTLHFLTPGPFDLDTTGTASNLADRIEALYGSDELALRTHMSSTHKITRIAVSRATETGEPLHQRAVDYSGINTGPIMPLQVAVSVTFKTAIRKRWGRVYLPGIAQSRYTPDGRIAPIYCDQIAEQWAVFSDGLDTPGTLVTHVTTSANSKNPSAVTTPVTAYQVDNVPDVIRSRRAEGNIYRALQPSRDLS
jgi:hypothetical protein